MKTIFIIDEGLPVDSNSFVPRSEVPMTISGLEPGQYRVVNTAASEVTTVYDDVAKTPEIVVTKLNEVYIDNVAPGTPSFSITITDHTHYNGTYLINPSVLEAGPWCLVPAKITGLPKHGETLEAIPGLWISLFPEPAIAGEWMRDGVAITDERDSRYTVDADFDSLTNLTYKETAVDQMGTRTLTSEAFAIPKAVPAPTLVLDTTKLAPADDLVTTMTDSGHSWRKTGTGVIKLVAGYLNMTSAAAAAAGGIYIAQTTPLGSDMTLHVLGDWHSGSEGPRPIFCITETSANVFSYYSFYNNNGSLKLTRTNGSSVVDLGNFPAANPDIFTIEKRGGQIKVFQDGKVDPIITATDANPLTGGFVGLHPVGTRTDRNAVRYLTAGNL